MGHKEVLDAIQIGIDLRKPPKSVKDLTSEQLLKKLPENKQDIVLDKLDSTQLLCFIEYCRRNCAYHHPITYDGAMIQELLPELMRRFELVLHVFSTKEQNATDYVMGRIRMEAQSLSGNVAIFCKQLLDTIKANYGVE